MSQGNGSPNSQSNEGEKFFENENKNEFWSDVMDLSDSDVQISFLKQNHFLIILKKKLFLIIIGNKFLNCFFSYEDLENVDETEIAEKLHKILDETLTTCKIDDIDKRIFSTHLNNASKTFIQVYGS